MADNASPWLDTTAVLAANATFTGPTRKLSAYGAGVSGASFFGATFYSDQGGTAYVDMSVDGSIWINVSTLALTGGSVNDLKVPIRAPWYRTRYVNGGTLQSAFTVTSSATQA